MGAGDPNTPHTSRGDPRRLLGLRFIPKAVINIQLHCIERPFLSLLRKKEVICLQQLTNDESHYDPTQVVQFQTFPNPFLLSNEQCP